MNRASHAWFNSTFHHRERWSSCFAGFEYWLWNLLPIRKWCKELVQWTVEKFSQALTMWLALCWALGHVRDSDMVPELLEPRHTCVWRPVCLWNHSLSDSKCMFLTSMMPPVAPRILLLWNISKKYVLDVYILFHVLFCLYSCFNYVYILFHILIFMFGFFLKYLTSE